MTPIPTDKHFLIVAGGDLDASVIHHYAPHRTVVALDGAAEHCYVCDVTPHVILGDFDSLKECAVDCFNKKEALAHFDAIPLPTDSVVQFERYETQSPSIMYVRTHHQGYTDLEKGVQFCIGRREKSEQIAIIIVGAFGGDRVDHAINNLSVLKKYNVPYVTLRMVDASQETTFLEDEQVTFSGNPGDRLGLLGFPAAWASSKGLKWEMDHLSLTMGGESSTSNELLRETVMIDVKGQALMVRTNRDFNTHKGDR